MKEKLIEIMGETGLFVDEPMSRHTTFRIGGPADYYVTPDSTQLAAVLALARDYQQQVTVIGNGSNLLVSDQGIRGIVIEIGKGLERIEISGDRMRIGAGTILAKAANAAADAGLSGMEFAAGIPGSLGGAVVMNAGAYGGEMKDILICADVFTPDGERKTLSREELDLGYRHSCIPEHNYIVLEATVQLQPMEQEKIRQVMADLREKRVSKQPLEFPSAGSTFKRPEGYFAGKLIQDAGLRGYTVGGAQVSEKHCGFVINRGNATATEVCQLMQDVQDAVFEKFGVRLEPEVKRVGEGM